MAQLPAAGEIALFDCSWYKRAGVEKAMGFCKPAQTDAFLAQVPQFEKLLVDDGLLLFKYWLTVDQAQQEARFAERLDGRLTLIRHLLDQLPDTRVEPDAIPCGRTCEMAYQEGRRPMDSHSTRQASPLYLLERFDVGLVHLDAERRVVGMNDFARRVLPVDKKQPFDRMVLSFHPERSQPKVAFLLDQASQCPVANPPPMTMIINIPERVLLIKVSRLAGADAAASGYVLVFYDITEFVSAAEATAAPSGAQRRLLKIPTVAHQKVVFVDTEEILSVESDGHYTRVVTAAGNQFCNLSIGDIQDRLDPEHFMRVHRSHLVNLRAVSQLLREDGRIVLHLHGREGTIPVSRSSAAAVLKRLGRPAGTILTARQG